MVFVFFSILKCKTTRRDSRGSGGSFNQTNTGGLQIKRSGDNFGNFPKGSLSLELKYKGLTYPIPYEKVKN